ncbi:hypothetical protein PT974_10235 [Cladobotryum mycophilum]|uniref:SUN domain-containing protein n=1 Tax=Cladobotryum mycophilum TaxID=491253 RepID=A0ABR0SAQ2_9HYPO
MPFVPWFRQGGVPFLLLVLGCLVHAHERKVRIENNQVIVITTSQCEARTINYITHSLPQSCLTSTWPNPTSVSTESSLTIRHQVTTNNSSRIGVGEPLPTADIPSATLSDEANGDPAAKPFMSFEDWKEMMLRRAGQDPQELRQRKSSEPQIYDRAPPEFGDSGLGEEGEISLSFDSYHDGDEGGSRTYIETENRNAGNEPDATLSSDEEKKHRSKDAGKTCKERFSYSSFDAGATILKTGQKTKNAKAILVENKDSYMLLECAAQNKYVIVELSDDVQIDTVVIANFEFFSSMIRHFRISVSDRYPVKVDKWRDLGIFEARNSRDIQPFLIQNPQIWARYVRVEFLTHYGNEYYCPVSLLRVHGSRMLDSWKDSETNHEEILGEEEAPPTPLQHSELTAITTFPKLQKVEGNFSELVNASRLWSHRFAQDFFTN